jgi:hypothetical protein
MVVGEVLDDEFGKSVAMRGDITGDGIADVLIGAPQHEVLAGTGRGKVYLYSGAVPTDAGVVLEFDATPSRLEIASAMLDDGGVVVRFALGPTTSRTRLDVYDIAGRHVRSIFDRPHAPGHYATRWDRRTDANARVARGVYLLRLRTERASASHKLVLR